MSRRVLLDTSAYSAFMRGHRQVRTTVSNADEIVINPIVLGELRTGFRRGKHQRKNERELSEFLSSPLVSLVDVDSETADRYAIILGDLLEAGTPIPTNDIWIAASAMQHGLRILTTDFHYEKIPQVVTDRFAPA